jgi:hypothetical protein
MNERGKQYERILPLINEFDLFGNIETPKII